MAEAQASESKYLESQGVCASTTQPYPNPYVPPSDEPYPEPEPQVSKPPSGPKTLCDAYVLAIPLGFFGAHHFYLRRYGFGFLYFFTFGLLGCGYLADLFRMPVLLKEANKRIREPTLREDKKLHEAYVLWFPMGLFGFHNFYLGRVVWGILYLCTFGLLGIGWLIDGIRMVHLVRHVNEKNEDMREHKKPVFRNLCDVLVLTLNPITGLLGIQHYYLHRVGFGLFYTFTLGGLGIGWLMDLFRMPHLVKDINKRKIQGHDGTKRLDDCYTLAFPLGFLGLHHFYLHRPCWGVVYFFTFGCLGIGWLVDLFRLPCLVRDYNRRLKRQNTETVSTIASGTAVGDVAGVYPYQGAYPPPSLPPQLGGASIQGANLPPQGAYPSAPPQYPQGSSQQMGSYPPPPLQGYPYPPPAYQPGVNYGAAGETSWSTINSSDFGDQPPSYEVSEDQVNPQLQNEANQQKAAPAGEKY